MPRVLTGLIDALHRTVYRLGYRLAKRWWRLTKPAASGAAVALVCDGRLLVLRHSYAPGLGLPAGGIKRGEDARDAAARELAEEVGIVLPAADLREVFAFAYDAHGRHISNRVFEARPDAAPPFRVDRREIVWADWMRPDEAAAERCNPTLRRYLAHLAPLPRLARGGAR